MLLFWDETRIALRFVRSRLWDSLSRVIMTTVRKYWPPSQCLSSLLRWRIKAEPWCSTFSHERCSSGECFHIPGLMPQPSWPGLLPREWQDISQITWQQQHFAFFDAAHLDLENSAEKATEEDAWALQLRWPMYRYASRQSFSKTFGLYAERVGALHVVCQTRGIAETFFDQLRA